MDIKVPREEVSHSKHDKFVVEKNRDLQSIVASRKKRIRAHHIVHIDPMVKNLERQRPVGVF